MPEIKKECHWIKVSPRVECGILTELVCRKKDCSFFETEAEFETRDREFKKKHKECFCFKRCIRCKKVKGIEDFVKNSRAKDGIGNYCLECNRENTKKYMKRKNKRG